MLSANGMIHVVSATIALGDPVNASTGPSISVDELTEYGDLSFTLLSSLVP